MKQTNAKITWVSKDIYSLSAYPPLEDDKPKYWRCDSQLEAKVLVKLLEGLYKPWKIYFHASIQIANFDHTQCLKGYNEINRWKPDFLISDGQNRIIVEAKGRIFQPFPYQYALCRKSHPAVPIFLIRKETEIDTEFTNIRLQTEKFAALK